MTEEANREDFFNEAQELIEGFSRSLLGIDAGLKEGLSHPELLNEAFRTIHTIKGLAGLFGAHALASLTHDLEDLLDGVRLNTIEVTNEVLDVLFGTVEAAHQLLRAERKTPGIQVADVEGMSQISAAISRLAHRPEHTTERKYSVEPGILSVLTEYEEHRLMTNLNSGLKIYRLRARFDLMSIDQDLNALKEKAQPLGEVLTYLPTGESSSPDILELDLILATGETLTTLNQALSQDILKVEEVPTARVTSSKPVSQPASQPLSEPIGLTLNAPDSSRLPSISKKNSVEIKSAGEQVSAQRSVRVDIRKLDRLMNIVGEMTILKGSLERSSNGILVHGNRRIGRELNRLHRNLERRLADLQDGILEMRMVPLGQVFDRLARGVRKMSRQLNKEVNLVITGSDTEIDKLLVEELGEPLLHMLRNAMDHGLESPEVRRAGNKPPIGTIALNAYQKGNHVMIEVEDDGTGIHEELLVERALQLGAVDQATANELSHDDIIGLMFLPGVTTSEAVSHLSGRGVGMDVVKTNIARLGGVIDIQSEQGIGTKMTLTLPITLSIVRALLVQVESEIFALPLASVSEVVPLKEATRIIEGREVMQLRGATLQLCRLNQHFNIAKGPEKPTSDQLVALAQVGERRLGLVLDAIVGQQDIVIKSLGESLHTVAGFSGAMELGDQRVALVLDAAAIVEEVIIMNDAPWHAAVNE